MRCLIDLRHWLVNNSSDMYKLAILFFALITPLAPIKMIGQLTIDTANALKLNSLGRWSRDSVTYRSHLSGTDAAIVSASAADNLEILQPLDQGASGESERYSTIAAIKALEPLHHDRAYLAFSGRKGEFVFFNTDLSAEVSLDTAQGIFIAPDGDETGANGAWVRQYDNDVKLEWFGAVGDNINDDQPAIAIAAAVLNAKGGGTIRGEAGRTYRLANQINLHGMANLVFEGFGATLFRYTAGSAASSFNIQNSKNITIRGWKIDSSYNGFASGSTGSNSNIFLQTAAGNPNDRIVIEDNIFNNGNHSHITVGQANVDSVLLPGKFGHQNIWVRRNTGSNAGTFTFIYKATRNVWVLDNVGENYSAAAFALDTSAAGTDSDTNYYTIKNVWIERNKIRNIVTVNRFAGRGIVLKGGVHNINVGSNIIDHIESVSNVETYGIIVTEDQHTISPQTGAGINIYGNSIKNVFSSASGATAGWAGSVAKGYDDVRITGNTFDTAERGFRASNSSSIEFRRNRFVSLSTAGEAPIQFICEARPSNKIKTVSDNTFIKAVGLTDTAIFVPASCSNVHIGINRFFGFTTKVNMAIGSTHQS